MKHTVKYWDKKLLSLQRLADSVGYDIDSDADYIAACACQPATFTESSRMQAASPEILPLFYNEKTVYSNRSVWPDLEKLGASAQRFDGKNRMQSR